MSSKEIGILAVIAAGTKRKKRTVNILKVAEALHELYRKHNSLSIAAKTVQLSPEMVRQFLKLRGLAKEVKTLIKKGLIDSIDTAYRISKLISKDQEILARSIIHNQLISKDVRNIVKYKIDNPNISIHKTISKVLESKVKKIYVAYLGIDKEIFEQLERTVKNQGKERLILTLFQKVMQKENIVKFNLKGRVVLLKMTRQGLEQIRNKARSLKIPLAKIANAIAEEYLKSEK